jgi:hypothetical protein
MGFRAIGRILKFSHVAVYNWIKEFGEQLQELKRDNKISIVEIDEIHNYVGNKKTIAGSGLLLIDIGQNSSISLLAREIQKQKKISGIN